jgi:hypothetical protein
MKVYMVKRRNLLKVEKSMVKRKSTPWKCEEQRSSSRNISDSFSEMRPISERNEPTNEARAEVKLAWTMPCKEEEAEGNR